MYNGRVRHIKQGDTVVALSGNDKGQKGKVLKIQHKTGKVQVEGMGVVKKHTKPTQDNPQGGILEKNRWLPSCALQVCDSKGKGKGRIGWTGEKSDKKRVFSSERK